MLYLQIEISEILDVVLSTHYSRPIFPINQTMAFISCSSEKMALVPSGQRKSVSISAIDKSADTAVPQIGRYIAVHAKQDHLS